VVLKKQAIDEVIFHNVMYLYDAVTAVALPCRIYCTTITNVHKILLRLRRCINHVLTYLLTSWSLRCSCVYFAVEAIQKKQAERAQQQSGDAIDENTELNEEPDTNAAAAAASNEDSSSELNNTQNSVSCNAALVLLLLLLTTTTTTV